MPSSLKKLLAKKALLFDVEGVLCDEIDNGKPLPSAVSFVKNLKKRGKKVAVISNIARKPRAVVSSRIREMGFPFQEEMVFTAGATAALYVQSNYPHAKCFVISEWGLRTDLEKQNITLVNEGDADLVLISVDRRVTYAELNQAAKLVLNGAKLICIGTTLMFKGTFLGNEGLFLGEAPFANAISMATKAPMTYIGKPYPAIFRQAVSYMNVHPKEAVMIGDTLASDIKGANSAGIDGLFLTKGRKIDLKKVAEEERPTFVAKDLKELNDILFG